MATMLLMPACMSYSLEAGAGMGMFPFPPPHAARAIEKDTVAPRIRSFTANSF
jgi:hypothetical protein